MSERVSNKSLLWIAIVAIVAIVGAHFVSTFLQKQSASGAGPQPSSAGGGTGA